MTETSSDDTFSGTLVRGVGGEAVIASHRQRVAVVTGPDRGRRAEVDKPTLTIGSADGNDLVLTDPTVSRRHCEITVRDGRYLLRDLESTNGTFVGSAAAREVWIEPQARFRVGDDEILFQPKRRWSRVEPSNEPRFGRLFGNTDAIAKVFGLLARVAPSDLSIVLQGETGTGKELAARAIHEASPRAHQPFIVLDCSAVDQALVSSELFGHERGAFTGAERQHEGVFELAHGGTIFLDEIGELPPALQPKLLRALEQREVRRLGGTRLIPFDVRLVAATHRDLPRLIAEESFREDLFYRLAEVVITLPPLRERRADIGGIARSILEEEGHRRDQTLGIDDEAIAALEEQPWPGNIRELRNVLRRAAVLAKGRSIGVEDLPGRAVRSAPVPATPSRSDLPIKQARELWLGPMEKHYLVELLERHRGDLNRAAQGAGLHRKSLLRLLRKHDLTDDDER